MSERTSHPSSPNEEVALIQVPNKIPRELLEKLLQAWIEMVLAHAPLVDLAAAEAKYRPNMLRGRFLVSGFEDREVAVPKEPPPPPGSLAETKQKADQMLDVLLYVGLLLLGPERETHRTTALKAMKAISAEKNLALILLVLNKAQGELLQTSVYSKPTPDSVASSLRYQAAIERMLAPAAKEEDQ
jgi:hypothetical protein